MTSIEDRKQNLAMLLMDIEAVEFGSSKLAKDRTNPNARPSPVFFNLRTPENPKPGRLTPEILMLMAELMEIRLIEEDLEFQRITGLPNAGVPIAEPLHRLLRVDNPKLGLIALSKTQAEHQNAVFAVESGEYEVGDEVLLIDDVVTAAHSKLEAIKGLESSGLHVAGILVLIDREQGGKQQLIEEGYELYSVFTITELLDMYVKNESITPERRVDVLDYINGERAVALRPGTW